MAFVYLSKSERFQENWGPVSWSSCGTWVGSRLVVFWEENHEMGLPPPLQTPPPLVATAGKGGCAEAGHRGPVPCCSRCWWPLESGNTTRPDPSFWDLSRPMTIRLSKIPVSPAPRSRPLPCIPERLRNYFELNIFTAAQHINSIFPRKRDSGIPKALSRDMPENSGKFRVSY